MIYMWFTGINYYKLAVEKDRDSIFTSITTISKPGFTWFLQIEWKIPLNRDWMAVLLCEVVCKGSILGILLSYQKQARTS